MEETIKELHTTAERATNKERQNDEELKSLLKSEISLRCQLDEYVEHATELENKVILTLFMYLWLLWSNVNLIELAMVS